jgi:hypothetical protein
MELLFCFGRIHIVASFPRSSLPVPCEPQIVFLFPSFVLNTDHFVSVFLPKVPALYAVHAFVRINPGFFIVFPMTTADMSAACITFHDRRELGGPLIASRAEVTKITTVFESGLPIVIQMFFDHLPLPGLLVGGSLQQSRSRGFDCKDVIINALPHCFGYPFKTGFLGNSQPDTMCPVRSGISPFLGSFARPLPSVRLMAVKRTPESRL